MFRGKLVDGVTQLASTLRAFAAVKSRGVVVTWGDGNYGGSSGTIADQRQGVVCVAGYHNGAAFAALKMDRTVVAWGNTSRGGNVAAQREQLVDVVELVSSEVAFAARMGRRPRRCVGWIRRWRQFGSGAWQASR